MTVYGSELMEMERDIARCAVAYYALNITCHATQRFVLTLQIFITPTFESAHANFFYVCRSTVRGFQMMFSYETKRASAYSVDLRWRMIWQREVLGMTNKDIAANLGFDSTTVWKTVKLFRDTGDVQPKTPPGLLSQSVSLLHKY